MAKNNFSAIKKYASFDLLKPKNIIMSAIKDRLQGTGVVKMVLIFGVETDHYKVMVSNTEGQAMKIEVTEDELTTIKKLFIKRIVNSYTMKFDEPIKDVIIQIDLEKEEFELFIQNPKDEVIKFDY
jgi:hypothetical protein